jgi:2-polyprenyl-6-methoxyphenol hydroxylase-like FAD-dependent oxidoreductase
MIAEPVRTGGDMAAALTAYDQTRRPRCQRIVRMGVMIERFGADVGPGWPQTMRNAVLRLAPAGPLMRSGAPIVRWTPP